MHVHLPFVWIVPLWAVLASTYLLAAQWLIWKRTGVNVWKIWWTKTDTRKTELRFADEIRKFPRWHLGYQAVKWGTLVVAVGYLAGTFVYLSRLH